jgi:hypothetical protein
MTLGQQVYPPKTLPLPCPPISNKKRKEDTTNKNSKFLSNKGVLKKSLYFNESLQGFETKTGQ